MTDWLMVIITAIYVIATIFICYFNYKSAKASSQQLEESVRQFNDNNKPFIAVYPQVNYDKKFCIEFKNIGNVVAKKLKVDFSKTILKDFQNFKSTFDIKLKSENLVLASEQSVYYTLEYSSIDTEDLKSLLRMGIIYVIVSYEDEDGKSYTYEQIVDTSLIDYHNLNYAK